MKSTKGFLLTVVSIIALSSAPALSAQDRHDDGRDQRDAQAGDQREQHAAEYHFRQEDAPRLRQHYKHIERVDVSRRVSLVAGGQLPSDWRPRMRAVPVAVVRELPAPPPGYVFGYIDGYCVVYNPTTLLIADVIDLSTLPH